MKIYYPYKSDKKDKKYYIVTFTGNKRIYFGAAGMNDFTIYSKTLSSEEANKKKEAYIRRHQNNEDWSKSGIDTAGFWSYWLLWNKPSIKESYEDIKKRFL
jgi:hypothetical protein